ncbi:MAG: hypothetical protein WCI95_02505 [bacterium]
MKRIACSALCLCLGLAAQADTMTLRNGQVVTGRFMGFADRRFGFKPESGPLITEYPVNVKSIVPEVPLKVSAELVRSRYEDAEFRSFDDYILRLARDGEVIEERVIMLKTLTVRRPPEPVSPPVPPPSTEGSVPGGILKQGDERSPSDVREWRRSGKWREVAVKNTLIISNGEVVDIEECLKKGFINIVHFHYPKALASIREGNYVEALAAKTQNRIVILKVFVPDFKAPICEALAIKSLPQFWFYNTQGRLVKKLTDRFTEGDIDEAVKQARR